MISSAPSERPWQNMFECHTLLLFIKSVYHCSWLTGLFSHAASWGQNTVNSSATTRWQLVPGVIHAMNLSSEACLCWQIKGVAVWSLFSSNDVIQNTQTSIDSLKWHTFKCNFLRKQWSHVKSDWSGSGLTTEFLCNCDPIVSWGFLELSRCAWNDQA